MMSKKKNKGKRPLWTVLHDDYLYKLYCSFCHEEIKFNTRYVKGKRKSSRAQAGVPTSYKSYHVPCWRRVQGVAKRTEYRVKNPVGRFGAKNGG